MDIEEYALALIKKGYDRKTIIKLLAERILEYKNLKKEYVDKIAEAVYEEALTIFKLKDDIINYFKTGVKAGDFGVGSRGIGDFIVHRGLAEISFSRGACISPKEQDDAGVVKVGEYYLTFAVDGMHSRLSEFPYLAGFHCARASLRDVYSMGSKPVSMMIDLRIADDGDVSKLFEFVAGVSTVAEACGVPIVAGSTLRIGGDMVLGSRLVGTVASVGISKNFPKSRKSAKEGDVILLTEGKGGGTISTIAIYHGYADVVDVTLNVEFMQACELLIEKGLEKINTLTDITNGGIRGDAHEISKVSGKKLVFYEEELRKSVNEKVLKMLDELNIDYLGVSTDSLMLILSEEYADDIKNLLSKVTKVYEVGFVEKGDGAFIFKDGKEIPLKPFFREEPYTRVKKVVGKKIPENFEEMQNKIKKAIENAMKKKEKVLKMINLKEQQ